MLKKIELTQTEIRVIDEALQEYCTRHENDEVKSLTTSLVGMLITEHIEELTDDERAQDVQETSNRSLVTLRATAKKFAEDLKAGSLEAQSVFKDLLKTDAPEAKSTLKVQFPDSMGGFA